MITSTTHRPSSDLKRCGATRSSWPRDAPLFNWHAIYDVRGKQATLIDKHPAGVLRPVSERVSVAIVIGAPPWNQASYT